MHAKLPEWLSSRNRIANPPTTHTHQMNSAITPQYRTHVNDPYVWFERHAQVVEANRSIQPEIILLGDSITHYWGGCPEHEIKRGPDSFNTLYGAYRTVNMGFGFDQTGHLLWRIQNGELDAISPKVVQILIGANNFHAPNSDEEIVQGILAVVNEVHTRLPKSKILLLGLMPHVGIQNRIHSVNAILESLTGPFLYANPGKKALEDPNGDVRTDLYCDGTHPNAKGYDALAAELMPIYSHLMNS